jgi:hypothetical protein
MGRAQLTPSPITGPAGNREFLVLLTREGGAVATLNAAAVDAVVDDGETMKP